MSTKKAPTSTKPQASAVPSTPARRKLARALGVSESIVCRDVARGMPEDLEGAQQWRRENVRQRAKAPTTEPQEGAPADYAAARARREAAEAQLAEMKVRRAAGELLVASEVVSAAASAATRLGAGLDGLGPTLAARLSGRAWSEPDVLRVIDIEVHRLRETLALDLGKMALSGREIPEPV